MVAWEVLPSRLIVSAEGLRVDEEPRAWRSGGAGIGETYVTSRWGGKTPHNLGHDRAVKICKLKLKKI